MKSAADWTVYGTVPDDRRRRGTVDCLVCGEGLRHSTISGTKVLCEERVVTGECLINEELRRLDSLRYIEKTTMTVTLRLASPDDEPFLYELYCSTRMEEMAAWGLDESQQKTFLELQFTARQRHYDIAFSGADHRIILCDDRPVGRMLVYRSEREIRLVDIALLPEHRSRGTGASLIQALLEEAKSTGKSVTLHVDKLNRAARLYERLGFSVIGDTGGSFKMECSPSGNQMTENE